MSQQESNELQFFICAARILRPKLEFKEESNHSNYNEFVIKKNLNNEVDNVSEKKIEEIEI